MLVRENKQSKWVNFNIGMAIFPYFLMFKQAETIRLCENILEYLSRDGVRDRLLVDLVESVIIAQIG